MDIEEIRQLIKNSTAVLVLDNGKPSFVVLDYNAYKNIATNSGEEKEVKIHQANGPAPDSTRSPNEREIELLDQLNKEILALKSQIEAEEKGM